MARDQDRVRGTRPDVVLRCPVLAKQGAAGAALLVAFSLFAAGCAGGRIPGEGARLADSLSENAGDAVPTTEIGGVQEGVVVYSYYGLPELRLMGFDDYYAPAGSLPFGSVFSYRDNPQSSRGQLTVACFLDYLQIPCLDGSTVVRRELYGERVDIRQSNQLPSGAPHDLMVVFEASDPDVTEPDRSRRLTNYQRITVAGADTSEPQQQFTEYAGRASGGRLEYGMFVSLAGDMGARDEHGGWKLLESIDATAGSDIALELDFDGASDYRYAVIAVLDWLQVPLRTSVDNGPALFISTKGNKAHRIPVVLPAPDAPGDYELRILSVIYPFAPLEELPLEERGPIESRWPNAFVSPKILLQVR